MQYLKQSSVESHVAYHSLEEKSSILSLQSLVFCVYINMSHSTLTWSLATSSLFVTYSKLWAAALTRQWGSYFRAAHLVQGLQHRES